MNTEAWVLIVCILALLAWIVYSERSLWARHTWRYCWRCERFFTDTGRVQHFITVGDKTGPDGICPDCAGELHYREA
jgi:MoaA/NifB/PqqE/SkfB family radical SAM enzyme